VKLGGWQKCSLIDFPGKVCAVLFTKGCSFRCPFCHNPGLVLPKQLAQEHLDEKIVFEFLQKRKGLLDGVVVSGGEPTIHADLPEFLTTIKTMGFAIKLDTNGDHPEMIERLIRKNLVDYWAMDRKASLPRYAQITGIPIDTRKIEQSSSLIIQSGLPYEFRTTLVRELHPPEEVEHIARELHGVNRFILQQFRPLITLDPKLQTASPYNDEEMTSLCERAKPYVQECFWR